MDPESLSQFHDFLCLQSYSSGTIESYLGSTEKQFITLNNRKLKLRRAIAPAGN